MLIMRVLLAVLADGVIDSVATRQRSYLSEVARYFDQRRAAPHQAPRRTAA